jgi:hypothetical protein
MKGLQLYSSGSCQVLPRYNRKLLGFGDLFSGKTLNIGESLWWALN